MKENLIPHFGVEKSCKAMGMPVSTYYYKNTEKENEDSKIIDMIKEFCNTLPESGYRSVTNHLKTKIVINKKRVQRLMQQEGLQCRKNRLFKAASTDSNHNLHKYDNLLTNMKDVGKKKIIVGDITYFDIKNKTHYLATLLDLSNREIIGYNVSKNIDTDLALGAFLMAKEKRSNLDNYIHHTDSDVRYCSKKYIDTLLSTKITISMCKGNAYENAFAESLNSTIKRQEIRVNEYDSEDEAKAFIEKFIDNYNTIRPHSALGGLSPLQYSSKFNS